MSLNQKRFDVIFFINILIPKHLFLHALTLRVIAEVHAGKLHVDSSC